MMKSDYYLSLVVLLQLIAVVIQLLLPLIGWISIEQAAEYRIYMTLVTYIPAAIIILLRNKYVLIHTFGGYFVFLLLNYVIYPESHTFIESRQAVTLTPISILTALIMISIHDFCAFLRILLPISRFSTLIAFLFVLATHNSTYKSDLFTYNMAFGYALLLPTLFLFYQRGIVDKMLSLLLFAFIVVAGSRGPAIVAGVFFTLYLFKLSSFKSKWKQGIAILAIGLLAFSFLNEYLDVKSSRTVRLYETGELISHDSNREEIYEKAISKIADRPTFGWGIGADRSLFGGYAHNIFIELTLHYGIVLTLFIISFIIIICVKFHGNKKLLKLHGGEAVFWMLILCGFVPLLVSSSYLIHSEFAMMIGYVFRYQISSKRLIKSQVLETILNKHGVKYKVY